jgi:cytidylate kinase
MGTDGSESVPGAPTMRAVTISREYGSGGGEIAARLAHASGWRLIDHEVVVQVAHDLGLSEEDAELQDEHVASFIEQALDSLSLAYPSAYPNISGSVPPSPLQRQQAYHEALQRVILNAADEGNVVIVGRGSHVVLADRRDVLRVAVVAPLPQRIVYVARREGLDAAAARERIQRKDQDRRRYLEVQYHTRPFEPEQFDLSVNTAVLTLDDAVELIRRALELKAARLTVPPEQLGPSAGIAPYPTRPEDVPLPQGAESQPPEKS